MRKLGTSTIHTGLEISIEENLDIIKDVGFDCVFSGYHDKFKEQLEELERGVRHAKNIGLEYETIHAPFGSDGRGFNLNSMWESGENGDKYAEYLTECIDFCSKYEIRKCILHNAVATVPPPISQYGIDRFEKLFEHAEKRGVMLGIENLEAVDHLAVIMGMVNEKHGFCWDCGHNLCYTPMVDMPLLYGKRMICTHIHDNLGITQPGNIHYRDDLHLLPFDGSLDWDWFAKKINDCGYKGPLTLELSVKPQYKEMGAHGYYEEAYKRALKLREMCDGE